MKNNNSNCVKWNTVRFNKPTGDSWTLQHRKVNGKVELKVEYTTITDGYVVCESSTHVGSDYHEAMMGLCIKTGLMLKPNRGLKGYRSNKNFNQVSIINPFRQLSKKKLNFYKNVAHDTYDYLVAKGLIITGDDNYKLYSFNHNSDIGKIRNSKQFINADKEKHDEHLYYIDIVHLETKGSKDIIELRKIHGKTGNSQYTQNYIHNSDESKNIIPISCYELHGDVNDLLSTREYLDACEKKCIEDYPIDITYLSRSNRIRMITCEGWPLINYSSKHITFKIIEEVLKNGQDGYAGNIKCNLLGVQCQATFRSTQILGILDNVVNYLFQLLLDRERVSIAKVYNRCIANFDHCMLDSKVYKKLKPILANKFIENFAD